MKKNTFVQGAMIATIGVILTKILGILYVIPFYAIIGDQGGALYGYAYTIYVFFINLNTTGTNLTISRLTSEYEAKGEYKLKNDTYIIGKWIMIILGFLSFLFLLLCAPLAADLFIGEITGGNTKEDVAFVIRVISTALLVVPVLSVTKGYMQGHKFITPTAISNVLEQVFRVAVIIIGSYLVVSVLGMDIKYGVAIAVFGATVGAIVAYAYIKNKMNKHKDEMNLNVEKTKIENKKEIILKILSYTIPFAISGSLYSLFNFVDLSTVVKTMVNNLGYSVDIAEKTISVITTWGAKLNMIVIAFATGMVTSVIPNLTTSFIKKDKEGMEDKINRTLQIIVYITLPLAILISMLAEPIWTVFYAHDIYNINVFKVSIFTSVAASLIMVTTVTLQTVNKKMAMIISVVIGALIKIFTTVPFMTLCDKLFGYPSYGAAISTILGFMVSVILMYVILRKELGINYKKLFKIIPTILVDLAIMILVVYLVKVVMPFASTSKLVAFIYTAIVAIIGALTYLFITYKQGVINEVFGNAYIDKILNKFKRILKRK